MFEKNPKIERVYFCRIEQDKSHAFSAIKIENQWFLLDSLKDEPKKMNSIDELFELKNAGIASIMIVRV